MKIYNPILQGEYIEELDLNKDTFITVDDKLGEKILKKYPSLVNYDLPQYSPDYYDLHMRPTPKVKRLFLKLFRK